MKIICVAYLHGAGGAERQIIKLANNLSKIGHFVSIAVLGEYNNEYDIDNNVEVIDLTYAESKGHTIINRYNALRKIYRIKCPDITINYWLQSVYLTSFMKKN